MIESKTDWLPLFPLNAVLFPDGILPLRVFEARYIDMVSECMRNNTPFGVVLIKSGKEVGAAAEPESVGCLAYITDVDMMDLGVLMLRTKGGERFRILETRELADHRLEARVEMLEADTVEPPSNEHVRCAEGLKNVMENIVAKGRAEQGSEFENPFPSPARLDDAGWIANRWCEILPIPLKARQKLLELEDAQSRLQIVYQFLQQHELL
jgi:Lon protease-like protein